MTRAAAAVLMLGMVAVAPEVVDVRSGPLTLRAQVWRPSGSGPFPAVLFNHGSYSTADPLPTTNPETLGSVFTRHGYLFLWLHREGTGLSSDQGVSAGDQMTQARQAGGGEARNRHSSFMHAENDYSTAPGPALAAEMQRHGELSAVKIYPPFGADERSGHNLIFGSVPTWESDVFAFLDAHLRQR